MTSYLEKRGKNKYLLVIENGSDPLTKKRNRKTQIFNGPEKQARRALHRFETEVDMGTYLDTGGLTFGEYLESWLKDYVAFSLSPNTLQSYKGVVNGRVIPLLGHIPLDKLKPMHLKEFYRKIIEEGQLDNNASRRKDASTWNRKPISEGRIKYYHRIIHRILRSAVEDELIFRNPADVAKPPKMDQRIIKDWDTEIDTHIKVLTEDQVKQMLEGAKNTPYYAMLVVDVKTGLRRGELLGLRWKDIDLDEGLLSVRQTVGHNKELGTFFKPPKNKGSRRTIMIDEDVITVLKKHQLEQKQLYRWFNSKHPGEPQGDPVLVFTRRDGQPLSPNAITQWFPRFLAKQGLLALNFHCLRHTHASLLLHEGVDIKQISERLGHSNIRITYDIYSHLFPDQEKEAVDKLRDRLR
jgi:integrase